MTDPRTTKAYDDFADEYANHTASQKESPFHSYYEKPAIRAEVPDLHSKRALSLGCGSGEDTIWLHEKGAEATGIDLSEGLIKIARKRYPECDFQVMDMEKLEFEDSTFDFAYSSLAIHYIKDWKKTLTETLRVLKSGSLYVFSTGHPIDSAMERFSNDEMKEAKLSIYRNKQTGEHKISGDYLALNEQGRKHISGELLDGMEVHLYHRPISKMIEDITASGFSIVKMIEPVPVEKMKEKDIKHYDALSRIPFFMIWVLQKK